MKALLWGLVPVGVVAIAACTPQAATGEIAGIATDIEGDPVRGARVFVDNFFRTETSPVGTFAIRNAAPGLRTVRVELTVEGVPYRGRNKAMVHSFERTTSVGVVVARVDQLGDLRGFVADSQGRRLAGVRVFAGGPFNSWMDITDSSGNYRIRDLVGGYTYTVTAQGLGYQNDTTQFSAVAGQTGIVNFHLHNSTNQQQGPVENLTSVAWTSPIDPNRSNEERIAYERIKRLHDPNRPASPGGLRGFEPSHFEIDLMWDYVFYNELLGYGIYRGTSPTGPLAPLDVLRDPLAQFYADISESLLPNVRFYYQVTRLNTDFPHLGGSQSPLSTDTSAVPLDFLNLLDSTPSPRTFRWSPVFNADEYLVYVFPYYPDFAAVPIWVSPFTSGTTMVYGGPSLTPGQRYYYVVLGLGFKGDSRTISQIDSFIAP